MAEQNATSLLQFSDQVRSFQATTSEPTLRIPVDFQIFEIITLRPMVWVCIQIAQKVAVGFAPVSERFICWLPNGLAHCIALGRSHHSLEPIR